MIFTVPLIDAWPLAIALVVAHRVPFGALAPEYDCKDQLMVTVVPALRMVAKDDFEERLNLSPFASVWALTQISNKS
jgi:hypothetical protein